MTRRSKVDERQSFAVEQGHLVRTVETRDGRAYSHRCSLESYKAVAHFIEEQAARGVTTSLMWEAVPDVPCTQASVAVAFLKERGCVIVRHRRFFPTSGFLFEDTMIEFHALEHEPTAPDDLANEAQAAQQANDWSQAAELWRKAAAACREPHQCERYLKQAAWCDDMAALAEETGD
jgi:hypothetical protein